MQIEFFGLNASREELREMHRSLLSRFIIENVLRQEQGLEPVDRSSLIERLEKLLGFNEEHVHVLFHQVEEELWAYSWYSYTDEWAWFRAKQDVEHYLGKELTRTKNEMLERLTEEKYQTQFETYVAEVDMQKQKKISKKQKQKK
ncbi:hypothetical protein EXS71_00545 [Candidatus Uhrbacteria bacterium]|nr:hypothetical protein [Candidatus Uhrbacteria bacterium]